MAQEEPSGAPISSAQWAPVQGHIMTRWAKDVTPETAWRENPRPQMVRTGAGKPIINLNGLWDYAITPIPGHAPGENGYRQPAPDDQLLAAIPVKWDGWILVPYPIESALSGVARPLEPDEMLWYHRRFRSAPSPTWRTILHIEACDWRAAVIVNGKVVGRHSGGYTPMTFDITDYLAPSGTNTLIVAVTDPTDTGGQPRGKQVRHPGGIFYTRTSGIWQTVWIEHVPAKAYIKSLHMVPDVNGSAASVSISADCNNLSKTPGLTCRAYVMVDRAYIATGDINLMTGEPVRIDIPDPHEWTPDDPFLYDLKVEILQGNTVIDKVESYFALREMVVKPDEQGVNRICLNGKPIFQFGPLDQGFWPDGIYTPPTDEAMKADILAIKSMGANMLRKHVKVEPARFYYWCDKLGVLVWQDMPSPFFRKPDDQQSDEPLLSDLWKHEFGSELEEMIHARWNHPCIVMWVPFNEGWGQNDLDWAREMCLKVKEWDPSRLVDNASGWTDTHVGDVVDIHVYPGPAAPPHDPKRADVLGEFGGLGLPVEGHTWVTKDNWGYVTYKNKEELTDAYVGLIRKLPGLIAQGLCAAVYTQTTDCEIECNGWMTYDRAVWKIDPDKAALAALPLFDPMPIARVILPTAQQSPQTWRYTTVQPTSQAWYAPSFDDSGWQSGRSGLGATGTPGAMVNTDWHTSDIWMRRTFELDAHTLAGLINPQFNIYHDEEAQVFLNGQLVASFKGYTTGYVLEPLSAGAKAALNEGVNTIAIHCHQTTGGQGIDVGITDLVPNPIVGR